MSTIGVRNHDATSEARVGKLDMKLEVVPIPVSDVDRAREFYEGRAPTDAERTLAGREGGAR